MNEDKGKATALDVLQSSALNARLLRRLTGSPGIIDVQMLRQNPARTIGLLAPLVSLFDELMARYAIDDGSTENQPLVMEQQPWLQNVNSYLTNYNSFSSTTNQFISIRATEQKSTAGDSFILPPGTSSREEASTSSQAETFRVHRRPARRAWESNLTTSTPFERNPALQPADVSTSFASAATSIKDQPAAHTDEQPAVSETSDLRSGRAKVIAAGIPASGDLPLAQAQLQGKPDAAARVERSSGQANQNQTTGGQAQLVLAKAGARTPAETPRNRITEDGHSSAEQSTEADKETGVRSKDVSREIVAHSSLRSNLESFDLIQSQTASSQLQKRATDFVWRTSADISTVRDLTSVDSSPRQNTAAASLPQLPQGSQTIRPESKNRKGEHGAGSRVMTERIVRNISRKLLIERERRGY